MENVTEDTAASLEGQIGQFIALFTGAPRQRSPEWLAKKATTVGGSELAALIGWNPYSSFEEVLGQKSGVKTRSDAGVACWWGTMFEAMSERLTEIDCGTRTRGTDIHVDAAWLGFRGHANSPDGYCSLALIRGGPEEEWRILFTDEEAGPDDEVRVVVVLLEFKAPYRRLPKGAVPKYYLPQVWSGLTLSPVAHFGLYVDVVYRLCALEDLGPSPEYNRAYHFRDRTRWENGPVAWGMTAVYAPRLGSAWRKVRGVAEALVDENAPADLEQVEPDYEAWRMQCTYFGLVPSKEISDPVDFGDCSYKMFDQMMGHVDRREFLTRHVGPRFADGRGNLFEPSIVGVLAAAAPECYYLLGVIPWKVMEISYLPVERNPGFLAEQQPRIDELVSLASEIRESANPRQAFETYCREQAMDRYAARKKAGKVSPPGSVNEEQIQDLFDTL